MIDRADAMKRIKAALKRRTGKTWSVTGDRGTAWGWINVQVQPKERTWHYDQTGERDDTGFPIYKAVNDPSRDFGYMGAADCEELGRLFGLDRPVHHQGLSITPDSRDWYVEQVEKG